MLRTHTRPRRSPHILGLEKQSAVVIFVAIGLVAMRCDDAIGLVAMHCDDGVPHSFPYDAAHDASRACHSMSVVGNEERGRSERLRRGRETSALKF